MNIVYPTQITLIPGNNYSNVTGTGDSYVDQLQSEIVKLKDDLKNETDSLDLHTKHLKENQKTYKSCIEDWAGANSGPHAGTTIALCDSQVLPNVKVEEKRVFDSTNRINEINNKIKEKENRIVEYLREKAKTDPNALAMLEQIEGKKSNKTILIVILSIVGVGALIGLYFYLKKKSATK